MVFSQDPSFVPMKFTAPAPSSILALNPPHHHDAWKGNNNNNIYCNDYYKNHHIKFLVKYIKLLGYPRKGVQVPQSKIK